MTAAIGTDLTVSPDVIEIADGSRLMTKKRYSSLGNRLVGATTLFGVAALFVLLGHVFFHSLINHRHVELVRLDNVITQESVSVRELRIELENQRAPKQIEKLASGVLGMLPAESATQIQVRREHLNSGRQAELILTRAGDTGDWLSVDRLLTEALAIAASNSGR
ncbi:MAG: hypothetical protein P8J75_11125 [Actinomycetota bacterium]|nr:hypothetical protein [Actinomycetota bacterium]